MTNYVQGLREYVRALEQAGVEAGDLKEVFIKIGELVQTDARTLAPKKTGKLGMAIKPTKTKNKASVRAGGARVPYAGAINYGWPSRNIKPSLFLQRAIDRNEAQALQLMDEGLTDLFNKLLKE